MSENENLEVKVDPIFKKSHFVKANKILGKEGRGESCFKVLSGQCEGYGGFCITLSKEFELYV